MRLPVQWAPTWDASRYAAWWTSTRSSTWVSLASCSHYSLMRELFSLMHAVVLLLACRLAALLLGTAPVLAHVLAVVDPTRCRPAP